MFIHMRSQLFQECMRLGQILTVRIVSFKKIRHSIKAETIYAHFAPVIEHIEYLLLHGGIIEIKIGLMMVEAMPVILLRLVVPCPVRLLKILEYDTGILILD